MKFFLQPWQLMLIILAGWINRQQQQVIEYLRTENAVLKEKLGEKRILLTDDQRCRLDRRVRKRESDVGLQPYQRCFIERRIPHHRHHYWQYPKSPRH